MKNLQYIFLMLVLVFGGNACASSKVTVEAGVVANIASAMRLFEKMNGHQPTNWMQISQILDLNTINQQSLINSPAYPLQQHYVFVTDKIPVPGTEMGDVVLIRTSAVKYGEGEEEREGRFIISKHDGRLKSSWLAETNVQKMLADAGITELPKPEPVMPATNSNTMPPPETYHQATNIVKKPERFANQSPKPEPQTAGQSANPVEPPNSASAPAVPTTSSSASSSFVKPVLIVLVAILGLAAAFVFLRSKTNRG